MSRYIDADNLKEILLKKAEMEEHQHRCPFTWAHAYRCFAINLDTQPTADVEPVRHGRWTEYTNQSMYINGEKQIVKYCSVCGEAAPYNAIGRQFYPARCYCGAKMDGKEDEE